MKDIINEFQSNLPPSARRCALRQFSFEVYPKFAIIERSSHSASKKFSLWLIRDRLYGDILRESHRRRRWRAWEIVKTIGRRKRNWKGWNSQTRRPATSFFHYEKHTNEKKRIENGAKTGKTRSWRYSPSSECLAHRGDLLLREERVVKGYTRCNAWTKPSEW